MVKNNENDMKAIENQYKMHQSKFKTEIRNKGSTTNKDEKKVYEQVEIKKSAPSHLPKSYPQFLPQKSSKYYTPDFHSKKNSNNNPNNLEKKVYQNIDVEVNKRDPNVKFCIIKF
jgi:hypothetical protein